MGFLESLFRIQKSGFFHLPARATVVMPGAPVAILDCQDEGHNLIVEPGAGRSLGPSLLLSLHTSPRLLSHRKEIKFYLFLKFILRERENESRHKRERGRERGRERIPSRLLTDSAEPNTGLEPTNCGDLRSRSCMTWPEIKSQTLNWLSHPGGAPKVLFFWSLHETPMDRFTSKSCRRIK